MSIYPAYFCCIFRGAEKEREREREGEKKKDLNRFLVDIIDFRAAAGMSKCWESSRPGAVAVLQIVIMLAILLLSSLFPSFSTLHVHFHLLVFS